MSKLKELLSKKPYDPKKKQKDEEYKPTKAQLQMVDILEKDGTIDEIDAAQLRKFGFIPDEWHAKDEEK